MLNLEPATDRLGALVRDIGDDQLAAPTPCGEYTLGDLLDHVGVVAVGFRDAAIKATDGRNAQPPPEGDASRLAGDWRTRIPADLTALAAAWREPSAWDGETVIAGGETPAAVVARVGVNELVVHGWDVARACGRPFDAEPELIEASFEFIEMISQPGMEDQRGSAFGPVVDVADDASALTRLLALNGRDPDWSPS